MTREEAVKIVKESMHLSYDDGNTFEALKTLVPELRESEDERIRKEMLNSLKEAEDSIVFTPFKKKRWIAYLEKQKEQKPVTHKYNVGATIYYNSFGEIKSMVVANVIDTGDGNPMYEDADGNDVFEKDLILQMHTEKQKSAEWSEEDEQYLLVCKNALNKYQHSDHWDANIISKWLENRLKSLRLQPKQELGEENKNTLECSDPFKRFVDMVHSVDKSEFTEFEYSIINFVLVCCDKNIVMTPKGIHCYAKTIRNIVKKEFPLKNCVWTDEEETVLHNACEFIRHRLNDSVCRNGSIGGMDYKVLYEKLESIKDRVQLIPHWKPREEQMSALNLASLSAYDDEDKEALKSLSHDLQKL